VSRLFQITRTRSKPQGGRRVEALDLAQHSTSLSQLAHVGLRGLLHVLEQGVIPGFNRDQFGDQHANRVFFGGAILSKALPFGVCLLSLMEDHRLKLLQGLLTVGDEDPIPCANRLSFGFGHAPPFLVSLLELVIRAHVRRWPGRLRRLPRAGWARAHPCGASQPMHRAKRSGGESLVDAVAVFAHVAFQSRRSK